MLGCRVVLHNHSERQLPHYLHQTIPQKPHRTISALAHTLGKAERMPRRAAPSDLPRHRQARLRAFFSDFPTNYTNVLLETSVGTPSFGEKIAVKAVEATYVSIDVDDVETEDGNSDEVVVRLSLFSVVRV